MKNIYFYCYSVRMKNFIKSQGLDYINKAVNPSTNRPYFMFEKSHKLDDCIIEWNRIKK